MKKREFYSSSLFWIGMGMIIITIIFLITKIYFLQQQIPSISPVTCADDYKDPIASQFSSFIDIYGVYIALVGAILTFLAFYIQYDFNKKQRREIKEERFLNQFTFLISLHNEKVGNLKLGKDVDEGQAGFHFLFYEFKSLCYYIRYYFSSSLEKEEEARKECIPNKKVLQGEWDTMKVYAYWGYAIFQSGLIDGHKHDEKLNERIVSKFFTSDDPLWLSLVEGLNIIEDAIPTDCTLNVPYISQRVYSGREQVRLYQGHFRLLSSYFRNIELIIQHLKKTKDNSDIDYMIDYCRNVFAAQLSTHEMGLIYAYLNYRQVNGENEVDFASDNYSYIFKEIAGDFSFFKFTDKRFFDDER